MRAPGFLARCCGLKDSCAHDMLTAASGTRERGDMGMQFEWIETQPAGAATEHPSETPALMQEPEPEPEPEPQEPRASEPEAEHDSMSLEEFPIPPSQPEDPTTTEPATESDDGDEDEDEHAAGPSRNAKRCRTPTSPPLTPSKGRCFSGIPDIHAPGFWALAPPVRDLALEMEAAYQSARTAIRDIHVRSWHRHPRTVREYCEMNTNILQGTAFVLQDLASHHREYFYHRLSLSLIGLGPSANLDAPFTGQQPGGSALFEKIFDHLPPRAQRSAPAEPDLRAHETTNTIPQTPPRRCTPPRPRTPIDLSRITCTPVHNSHVAPPRTRARSFRTVPTDTDATTNTHNQPRRPSLSREDAFADEPPSVYAPFRRSSRRRTTVRRTIQFIQRDSAARTRGPSG